MHEKQITCSLAEASRWSGLSISYLRAKIKDGRINSTRIGRRLLIDVASLKTFLLGSAKGGGTR